MSEIRWLHVKRSTEIISTTALNLVPQHQIPGDVPIPNFSTTRLRRPWNCDIVPRAQVRNWQNPWTAEFATTRRRRLGPIRSLAAAFNYRAIIVTVPGRLIDGLADTKKASSTQLAARWADTVGELRIKLNLETTRKWCCLYMRQALYLPSSMRVCYYKCAIPRCFD